MVAAVLLLIVWDLLSSPNRKTAGLLVISLAAFLYSAGTSAWLLSRDAAPQNLFYGLLAFDRFSNMFRILFALVSATVAIFSVPPRSNRIALTMTALLLTPAIQRPALRVAKCTGCGNPCLPEYPI